MAIRIGLRRHVLTGKPHSSVHHELLRHAHISRSIARSIAGIQYRLNVCLSDFGVLPERLGENSTVCRMFIPDFEVMGEQE
jgi:hypothetical protein